MNECCVDSDWTLSVQDFRKILLELIHSTCGLSEVIVVSAKTFDSFLHYQLSVWPQQFQISSLDQEIVIFVICQGISFFCFRQFFGKLFWIVSFHQSSLLLVMLQFCPCRIGFLLSVRLSFSVAKWLVATLIFEQCRSGKTWYIYIQSLLIAYMNFNRFMLLLLLLLFQFS